MSVYQVQETCRTRKTWSSIIWLCFSLSCPCYSFSSLDNLTHFTNYCEPSPWLVAHANKNPPYAISSRNPLPHLPSAPELPSPLPLPVLAQRSAAAAQCHSLLVPQAKKASFASLLAALRFLLIHHQSTFGLAPDFLTLSRPFSSMSVSVLSFLWGGDH